MPPLRYMDKLAQQVANRISDETLIERVANRYVEAAKKKQKTEGKKPPPKTEGKKPPEKTEGKKPPSKTEGKKPPSKKK